MADKVQALRSSIAGARPAGRSPGELYVNFADHAFGYIDAAGVPQDLPLSFKGVFQATRSYALFDVVVNPSGTLSMAVVPAIPAGAFNAANWQSLSPAPPPPIFKGAFSAAAAYVAGDVVVGTDYAIYQAKANIAAGAFNEADWEPLGRPDHYISTADPTAADGVDGDIWFKIP
jgi:hypothetical protein